MKLLTLVSSLAVLASSVSAFAIPNFDEDAILDKRATFLAVTGAPGTTTHTRYEIRQLPSQQSKQWDLYIQAMAQFQAVAQPTQTSYYQIAGIHGVPRVSWNGVGECSSCAGSNGAPAADGYCTHDSVLFLGWHRAYLALFEQQLVKTAISIANTYPSSTKSAYVAAASALRMPYWDWAAKPASGNTLPSLITQTSVTINGPAGSKTIANPLYQHTFRNAANLRYTPFTSWPNTLRYPTSNDASATSNEGTAISAFNNIRGSLQDQVYQLFSTCSTFAEIADDVADEGTSKCANSFEGIHNTVHTTTGGPKTNGISGGHMTYLSTAAFDPVFWLHHTNVDRLFAMWQAIYPGSYGASQVAPHNTWTIAKGTTQGVNSPLTPFTKDTSGNFWTTAQVQSTSVFHYTYPEFADSDGSKSSITNYVNALYGPSASKTAGSSKRDAELDVLEARNVTVTTPLVANNGSLFQYVANVQTSRYALGGTYNIYIFNNDPASEDPATWILDPNLVGPIGILASEAMTSTNIVASGSIPLTRTLTDLVPSALTDLTEANVVPYLTANLRWRVAGPNGTEVDPNTIPDFDVSVYASTASQPGAGQLPVWSTFIPLADITKNQAGGATPATIQNATSAATSAVSAVTSAVTSAVSASRRSVRL